MKKIIFLLILILSTFMLLAGCSSGGEAGAPENSGGIPASGAEALTRLGIDSLSGSYTGMMTLTKVEVVYDSEDVDEDGNVLHYYRPEGTSEWEGDSVDATLDVVLEEDTVRVLNSGGETAFAVTYDPLTGTWGNSKIENTEVADCVNETVLELTKAE
ncbi:MAG TPA: hypothetical protein VEA58_05580 [Anaerovoracaceae bacterium]|nr:hypothetical protein [Anaerovoracaceae bacterium]